MAIGETISRDEFNRRYSQPQQSNTKKSFGQKMNSLGHGLGKVFGGDVIGEALGAQIAKGTFGKTIQKAVGGYNLSEAEQNSIQGPSGKAVVGDVLKSAASVASAAIPGAGSLLGKVAQGAALGYATDVGEKLISGKSPFTPGAGTAIGAGLPFASALVGNLVKRGVALTTGAGREVIDRAVHNPTAVHRAIREYASTDASKLTLVEKAKVAVNEFLSTRSKDFSTGTKNLTFNKPFNKSEIVESFSDEVKRFKGRITPDGLEFKSSPLSDTDAADLQTFWQKLQTWQDFTPTGVDDLRQAISNHMDDFSAARNSRASVVLGNLKKFVTAGLEQRAPGYKKMLTEYGSKTGTAKMLIKELNLTNNVKPSTQIGSLLKLFRKDPEVMRSIYKTMGKQEADNMLNELSGAILSEWLPIGNKRQLVESVGTLGGLYGIASGGLSILPTAAAVASASPRIVGEVATKTGQALNAGVGTAFRRAATIGTGRAAN